MQIRILKWSDLLKQINSSCISLSMKGGLIEKLVQLYQHCIFCYKETRFLLYFVVQRSRVNLNPFVCNLQVPVDENSSVVWGMRRPSLQTLHFLGLKCKTLYVKIEHAQILEHYVSRASLVLTTLVFCFFITIQKFLEHYVTRVSLVLSTLHKPLRKDAVFNVDSNIKME